MYAKKRKEDRAYQSLDRHLFEVSALVGFYAKKLGLKSCGLKQLTKPIINRHHVASMRVRGLKQKMSKSNYCATIP